MRDQVLFANRQKIVLMICMIGVLLLMPVIVYSILGGFYSTDLKYLRAIAGVRNFLYLILSPFVALFAWMVLRSFRMRIQVTHDRVRFHFQGQMVMLYWHEINAFRCDYHRIGSLFNWKLRLFEIADGLKGCRFHETLPASIKVEGEDSRTFSKSSIRSAQVYKSKSFGIELSHEDCEAFIATVREKTGLSPVKTEGLFEK